jgi:hypothetical protein
VVRINTGAAVTNLIMAKASVESGFNAITAASGSTLANVTVSNLSSIGTAYPLGFIQSTTALGVSGLVASGATALLWVQGAGAVTLTGMTGINSNVDTVLGNVNIAAASSLNSLNKDPDRLAAGEETVPRLFSTGSPQPGTGQLILTYFTARRTETVNNINTLVLGTAAAGTTLARMGVYSVASNGDLTLVASTANDTTLWNTTFSGASRALTAPLNKVAGQRYAFATLFVGTTAPKFSGVLAVNGITLGKSPRLAGSVASQTDLPSTITSATVSNSQGTVIYGELLP